MLIWNYWPGAEGGTEKQCRRLVQALGGMGVDCTVVTHWPGFGFRRRETDDASRIRRLGIGGPLLQLAIWVKHVTRRRVTPKTGSIDAASRQVGRPRRFYPLLPFLYLERLSFMLGAALFLWKRRAQFEIIHIHESHWIAGFGALMGSLLKVPALVKEASFPVLMAVTNEAPWAGRWRQWRLKPFYVAQTEAAARALANHGIPGEKIFVVPNGVRIPDSLAQTSANATVLYVGNLTQGDRWKSFAVLFDAWKLVHAKNPQARLVLVGAGDSTAWRQHAAGLGLQESVSFAGPSQDMDRWYRSAAILVLPSYREGLSNALLEAQSWGVSAVVSDIPGNRAVVSHGENGLVFPPGDAAALAQAILDLLSHPELRAEMGRAARCRIEADFAMARTAQQTLRVYERIARADHT